MSLGESRQLSAGKLSLLSCAARIYNSITTYLQVDDDYHRENRYHGSRQKGGIAVKRLICILLAVCLPMTALADTIAERIGAPEHWQGECQSNTGKTRVFVDMAVQVPDVEAIPIWAVKARTFAVEEVTHAADVFLGEGNWQSVGEDWPPEPLEGEPQYTLSQNTADHVTCYYLHLADEQGRSVSGTYAVYNSFSGWYLRNFFNVGLWTSHPGRNIGMLEDAISLADSVVSQVAPEMVYESRDLFVNGSSAIGIVSDNEYQLHYARHVAGIMVTPIYQRGNITENPQYAMPLQYERFEIDVGEEGNFSLHWEHPIQITGMMAEDCELLPFGQIMDVFTTICPLKYQVNEANGSTTLHINRATLGYMCLQERGNPANYRLVPVWDFFGTRDYHGDHDDIHNWSYFTINAIDGTVIDRSLGY